MAIVDVIKHEISDTELVGKFKSDNIKIGSQLIVYPSQTAFFVKGGKILDEFTSGTYTLNSENIPILNKVVNIPFGGDTPLLPKCGLSTKYHCLTASGAQQHLYK